MSDLISKSALIKVLKDRATNEAIMGYMTAYDVTNSIIDEVEEQPTAYSVDKVVNELEKATQYIKIDGKPTSVKAIHPAQAIEIVKQGGVGTETETIRDKAVKWNNNSSKRVPYAFIDYVEGKREIGASDDVCEYENTDDEYCKWKINSVFLETINNPHVAERGNIATAKYCPCCGKKIKVVE